MVETLDAWIRAVGPLGYLALFAASLIEYVFPPFPGDTVVLLGGVFAVRGQRSWVLVLAAVTLGSVVGAALDYLIGSRLARRFGRRGDFAERHPHLFRLQEKMRGGGIPLIAFNRFMPGVRGLIFLAAGASGMDFGRVMAWGALSALLWNALILGVGLAVPVTWNLNGDVPDFSRRALNHEDARLGLSCRRPPRHGGAAVTPP